MTAPADETQLRGWFDARLPANVAVAAGPSHLVIIDEDKDGALAAYAESIGEAVPQTFTVRSYRGAHHYFAEPLDGDGERVPLGNSAGALGAWGCDVRGGASDRHPGGGYVIGPGSVHWSGVTYTVERDVTPLALPGWLIEAINMEPPGPPEGLAGRTGDGRATGGTRPGRDERYAAEDPRPPSTAAALRDTYLTWGRQAANATGGGDWRWALFAVARAGWRLVALGLLTEDELLADLDGAAQGVWGADLDDDDHVIVFEQAQPAAEADPWTLTAAETLRLAREARATAGEADAPERPGLSGFTSPGAAEAWQRAYGHTTDGNRAVGDDRDSAQVADVIALADRAVTDAQTAAEREHAGAVTKRVEWLDVDAEAKRQRAERDAVEVRDVTAAEFFAMPPPRYLVPGMIHRDGIAVLFGAPHSGKSFLMLDIALSFASGKPWCLGEGGAITLPDGTPGIVHYVMAEAPGTNIGRGNAWLQFHGITAADLGGRFIPILDSFLLTEAGIAGYLRKVARDHPDLIIYDTRSAMFDGKESAGEDYAAMLRAMRTIREVNDKECAQAALDHTGLNDPDRPRGNNAWEAGSDSMILITKDKDSGLHTVTPKRVRNERESDAEWAVRRETVIVDGRSEAVLVAAQPDDHQPFPIEGTWWTDDTEVPDGVLAMRGNGRTLALLIFRVLRWVGGTYGLTVADVKAAIEAGEAAGARMHYDRTKTRAALTLLTDSGVIEHPSSRVTARWILTSQYAGPGTGQVLG